MNRYSKSSESRLKTCHPGIQRVFKFVLKNYDHTIVCGHRNKQDQNNAYYSENSKVKWPESKHNEIISRAIDVVPYPTMWDSKEQLYHFAGYVNSVSDMFGVKLRWGGDWDGDKVFNDQKFMDLGHWELVG
jgi:peptidoglycan L-alanyl-D-glutamate endopeptidase CwlK